MSSEVSFGGLPFECGIVIAALREGPSRIAMRLFNEANIALAYLRQHRMSAVRGYGSTMIAQFPNNSESRKQILE
jgi:hypothetical protein